MKPIAVFTLLALSVAAPGWALRGRVIDARSQAPVANAEITIVGQRGSVRSGPDGAFEWELPAEGPFVFIVILPDGFVSRAIRVTNLDDKSSVTLVVEGAVAESVDVTGAAPAIDVSAGASASVVTAADARLLLGADDT